MRKALLLTLFVCPLFPRTALAQPPEPSPSATPTASTPTASTSAATAAYCRYVRGVAGSTEALLVSPELFATFGVVSGLDDPVSQTALPPATRYIFGAQYSLSHLVQGVTQAALADADCERTHTITELHAFVEANREGSSKAALTAKLAVLDGAMPHAQEILAWTKAAMDQARATADQLNATQLRVDELRTNLALTRQQLDTLATSPSPPTRPITEIIKAHDDAESNTEKYAARIREAQGWDLQLKGGYDRVSNLNYSSAPLFGLATVTFNIGWLFQGGPDDDAIRARGEAARTEIEGVDDRAVQLITKLRAVQAAEKARLKETETLLADLEGRVKDAQAVGGGDRARLFLDVVWFDLIRVKAEHEYLRVHVQELAQMLGDAH
jgi:hypothetical protein